MNETPFWLALNWPRVVAAVLIPLAVAYPLAWFLRRHKQGDVGNVIATGIILAVALLCVGMEFVDVQKSHQTCTESRINCHLDPNPFGRMLVYAVIGVMQVSVLYVIGMKADERERNRDVWR